MAALKLEARDVSEGSLLLGFPGQSDADANRVAVALARRLAKTPPRGLLEAIPGARTLFLVFDPLVLERGRLARTLQRLADAGPAAAAEGRLFRIPVAYGGAGGPDLDSLASDRGITPPDVVRRHSGAEYTVAFLGFSPGFAYLTGLPAELATPRRGSPRPRVPAGSVAIGGEYSAIYPQESPGGWRLIGRSSVRLFDAAADSPALLSPGDRVRFEPIGADELDRRLAQAAAAGAPAESSAAGALFEALAPGLFASVQGAPRYGLGACGVPAGGAMDLEALERGNRAVGNPPGAAGLEIALSGPDLAVRADCFVCVSGADLDARWNGLPIPVGAPFEARAGDRISFGYTRRGARAYLCVRGGLVEPRLGETVRRLARGDVVEGPSSGARRGPVVPEPPRPSEWSARPLRVLAGPQAGLFSPEASERFFSATYRVSPESDRRGIRLDGPALEVLRSADIPPEGTALGAIQVPSSGLPIVLGPDRPVTGGYAKIGALVARDWRILAQAPPGTAVRFEPVTLGAALAELGSRRSISDPGLTSPQSER